jgi:hypothetical protein
MPVILLAVILALQVKPSSPERPSPNHRTTSRDSQSTTQKQSDSSTKVGTLPASDNISDTAKQEADSDKMEERRDRKAHLGIDRISLFIAGFGVLGAWVGLGLLTWQNILTRKAANAALLNAKAVINSERPWVIVKAEPSSYKKGGFILTGAVRGRTPARIVEIYSHRTFVDQPDNLPPSPKYELPVIAPKEPLLGDGESFKIAEVNPAALVDEEWKAKHPNFNSNQFLCFYGIVRYEDCVATGQEKLHETRWCFSYFAMEDNDLHPIGPEEYCRKT